MALRDLPYRRSASVFVLEGLRADVVDRIPAAVTALVRRDDLSDGLRRARSAPPIVHLDPAIDDTALVNAVLALPTRAVLAVALAGDRIAVRFAHRVFDGSGCLAVVAALLRTAAELPPVVDPRERAALPVISAMHAMERGSFTEMAARRGAAPVTAFTSSGSGSGALRMVSFRLSRSDLAALRLARSTHPGRATTAARVCSLVVLALRGLYTGDGDPRVRVPVDLRHHARECRVDGNFVCGDPLGTLLGTDWDPVAVTRRLAVAAGGSGVASLLTGQLRALGALLRAPGRTEVLVTVSIAAGPRHLPLDVWRDPGEQRVAVVSVDPHLAGVFVHAWTLGDDVHITASTPSPEFDLARLEESCRAAVAAVSGGRAAEHP